MAGTSLLSAASGLPLFWLGSAVYGVGTGLLSYCSLTRLMQVEGEKGKIAALFSLSIAIGNTIGPVSAGYVGRFMGIQAVFLLPVGLMLLVLGAVAWRSWRSRPAVDEAPADGVEC
jgi:MFS family permease